MAGDFQIIEPRALAPLLARASNHVFATALLGWLSGKLNRRLRDEKLAVEVDGIPVEHHDVHPTRRSTRKFAGAPASATRVGCRFDTSVTRSFVPAPSAEARFLCR